MNTNYEVWVSSLTTWEAIIGLGEMRFNAKFDDSDRASEEATWYQEKGYRVEVREVLS